MSNCLKHGKYNPCHNGEIITWTRKYGTLRLACCDCGLTHDLLFKRMKTRFKIQIIRNDRSTGQVRRFYTHKFRKKDEEKI